MPEKEGRMEVEKEKNLGEHSMKTLLEGKKPIENGQEMMVRKKKVKTKSHFRRGSLFMIVRYGLAKC